MNLSEPGIRNTQPYSYNKGFVLMISLIASMGGLLFGFDLGVITGVIPFIQHQFSLEGFALGWVVAIFELGCMGGTFITAWLADKIGRKKGLLLTALSFIITAAGAALAQSSFELALWRFLQGVGVGAASVLSPMYIAEMAPALIRGKLVSLNQLMIILGFLLATIVSYYFGDPGNLESWRWMFGFALIPSILFLLALFIIPESPRWLFKNRPGTNSARVLRKIGNEAFVKNELEGIKRSLHENNHTGNYRDLLGKTILPILLMGFGLAILQQFSGSNNVTAYLQVIFQKANISIKDGLLNAVFVGLVLLAFTILAILTIDRVGRKKLLLIGTSLMAIFLFILAWSFNSTIVDGRLVFIVVLLFIGTYAFTLAPVTWVLLSEIFPNYIRGKALSMTSAVLWLACFIVVFISPYLLKVNPVVNFMIFGVFNLLGFFFTWRFVPETKGKSLEEIETMLVKKNEI